MDECLLPQRTKTSATFCPCFTQVRYLPLHSLWCICYTLQHLIADTCPYHNVQPLSERIVDRFPSSQPSGTTPPLGFVFHYRCRNSFLYIIISSEPQQQQLPLFGICNRLSVWSRLFFSFSRFSSGKLASRCYYLRCCCAKAIRLLSLYKHNICSLMQSCPTLEPLGMMDDAVLCRGLESDSAAWF